MKINDKERELVCKVLYDIQMLFQLFDLVFSKLQTCTPTKNKIEKLSKIIKKLEVMWREIELNITPTCHIWFSHTIEQLI